MSIDAPACFAGDPRFDVGHPRAGALAIGFPNEISRQIAFLKPPGSPRSSAPLLAATDTEKNGIRAAHLSRRDHHETGVPDCDRGRSGSKFTGVGAEQVGAGTGASAGAGAAAG